MGHPPLFSCCCWRIRRERLKWWLHPLHMTQQYHLASMAAWLSSTGISHQNVHPHVSLLHLQVVNSSPCSEIALQSLYSSSQLLHLLGDLRPCLGVHMAVARIVWFSFHLCCHRSAASFSVSNVSPLTQTIALSWGLDPYFSSSTHRGQGVVSRQSYQHSCFFTLVSASYQVFHGSIYSFSVVRYSCPLSAGVLQALLCLKMYSWCILGERCNSTSTYFSTILLYPFAFLFILFFIRLDCQLSPNFISLLLIGLIGEISWNLHLLKPQISWFQNLSQSYSNENSVWVA